MKSQITTLLDLAEKTANFNVVPSEIWKDDEKSIMLFCGKGLKYTECPSLKNRANIWLARSGLPFNLETATTGIIYAKILFFVRIMIDNTFKGTADFSSVTDTWIHENAHLLPILMHALGTFSKQELKKIIGSVSDRNISKPASKRLEKLFVGLSREAIPSKDQIAQRMRVTTEGIVRDLVGRMLLEAFVASALEKEKIPFLREKEYATLSGVVYNFRADFVIPNEKEPKAFIEVRKSSSRHASLYAKDKMFSAINWKGKHPKCLGILVVDGPWTENTLHTMAKVFDYVVPVGRASEVANTIKAYINGDTSVLRWLIQFQIDQLNP